MSPETAQSSPDSPVAFLTSKVTAPRGQEKVHPMVLEIISVWSGQVLKVHHLTCAEVFLSEDLRLESETTLFAMIPDEEPQGFALRSEGSWSVHLPKGAQAQWLGKRRGEDVCGSIHELGPTDRMVVRIGPMSLFLRRVYKAQRDPLPFWRDQDRLLWGIALLLAVSAALFFLVLAQTPPPPKGQIERIPDRLLEIMLPVETPPKELKSQTKASAPGGGSKSRGKEGVAAPKTRPNHRKVPRHSRHTGIQRRISDRKIVEGSGLILALNTGTPMGPPGIDDRIANGLLGLHGTPNIGNGVNGWGTRGLGLDGGGDAEALGPIGTGLPGRGGHGPGGPKGFGFRKGSDTPEGGQAILMSAAALDKSVIDRVVKQHLPQIRYCYQRQLARQPSLSGKVVVSFTIAANGAVSSAGIGASSLAQPQVHACITERFRAFHFPAPKGGGIVKVRYPFVFSASK